jgi:hypothetical protein
MPLAGTYPARVTTCTGGSLYTLSTTRPSTYVHSRSTSNTSPSKWRSRRLGAHRRCQCSGASGIALSVTLAASVRALLPPFEKLQRRPRHQSNALVGTTLHGVQSIYGSYRACCMWLTALNRAVQGTGCSRKGSLWLWGHSCTTSNAAGRQRVHGHPPSPGPGQGRS